MPTDLIITRVFEATRELMWQAWTDPQMFMKWWGPKDFTAPTIKIDLKEGGKFVYCMRGAAGLGAPVSDFWNTGEFTQIVPMEKLVSTMSFADAQGNPVPASHYNMPGQWPDAITLTVTLENPGSNQTKVTVREAGVPAEMSEFGRLGWEQSFDKLAAALKA